MMGSLFLNVIPSNLTVCKLTHPLRLLFIVTYDHFVTFKYFKLTKRHVFKNTDLGKVTISLCECYNILLSGENRHLVDPFSKSLVKKRKTRPFWVSITVKMFFQTCNVCIFTVQVHIYSLYDVKP